MHSTFFWTLFFVCLGAARPFYNAYQPPQDWIPEVQHDVEAMMEKFELYAKYHGPSAAWLKKHPNAAKPSQSATAVATPQARAVTTTASSCDFWLEDIQHQGIAAFNPSPSTYQVFRNVKDFGAKGDGVTDDTAAINQAISSGSRCAPGSCNSTTVTPAIVYFPAGTYMISSSIIDYYYTQLIGNPNCIPTIRAFSTFSPKSGNIGLIDGDPYVNGVLAYGSTNVFWRQIRNFIIDMTLIPASSSATGIHWPTGQASSIQNVVFQMSDAKGTQHQGLFIESGSGGFMTDLVFNGGLYGCSLGNQQFTMKNLQFNNAVTAIFQVWDWGWTYYGITINNCSVGLDTTSGGTSALSVGSVTFFDSTITNTPVGIKTGYISGQSKPATANSLILENLSLSNVQVAVQSSNGKTYLAGSNGNLHISAWGQGHKYTPSGPTTFQGSINAVTRPASLTFASNGSYYERSKPQYQQYSVTNFISARSYGATGNGHTDDTANLQSAINAAVTQGKILFVDQGDYLVSSTILIPAGSKIVGETYSVILSSGSFFNNIKNPQPVVRIGNPGDTGSIEWSDMIVSTQGQQQGAILVEYNLNSPSSTPSGIWDVHTRVGGFKGSNLQLAKCPTTPNTKVTSSNVNSNCIAAFMMFHVTSGSSGLYMENNWLWTADHDVEDAQLRQITVYSGRGLFVESSAGTIWLVGTSVEHNTLYQYQFVGTQNVFAGQIQTETPYYQPNPFAPTPFPYNATYSDPQFSQSTIKANGYTIPAADAWGVRIVSSKSVSVYGAGLYSFFNNYSTSCSAQGNGEICQNHILSVDSASTAITVYNENTVGTHYMLTVSGTDTGYYNDNLDGFVDTIALFRKA